MKWTDPLMSMKVMLLLTKSGGDCVQHVEQMKKNHLKND